MTKMQTVLERFDRVLNWVIGEKHKNYALHHPQSMQRLEMQSPLLQQFAKNHGYFSRQLPIVGCVSKGSAATRILLDLLRTFPETTSLSAISFATLELLAKALAYRDLVEGETVLLPVSSGMTTSLCSFRVDCIFNLWHGMPAIGLLPREKESFSFLLFRGTDFSLFSKRSFASLLSDLDPRGPGYFVFQRTRGILRDWLKKTYQLGSPARLVGYSLGGSLAAFTYIYENDLINREHPSMAFNPPGMSKKVLADGHALGQDKMNNFVLMINRWDPISKVGKLFGRAYELSCGKTFSPIIAHTLLLSGEETIFIEEIDVAKENHLR